VKGQYDLQVCDVRESDSGTYICVDEAGRYGAQWACAQLLVTTQTANQLHKTQTSGIVDVTTSATSPSLPDSVTVIGIVIATCLLATFLGLFIRIRQQQRHNHQINETDKNEIIPLLQQLCHSTRTNR
jgi:beta-lactamase regulating signal transducer with metallopeptidase domain